MNRSAARALRSIGGPSPAEASACDRSLLQIANLKFQISNWCASMSKLQSAICNLQSSFLHRHADRCAKSVTNARCHAARRGFTLVELLAALGISLLLIAAISASLDIYLHVTTAGQSAIERQQVTRALLDQMTRDVASIVFRPAEAGTAEVESGAATSDAASGADADNGSEAESTTITVQDPQAAMATTSLGLVGDAHTLLLHISRPLRDLNYAAPQTATMVTARTSDLLSVAYFLAATGADGLPGAVAAQYAAGQTSAAAQTTASGPAGLARLEGDRMAMDHADLELDTGALASAARVIAPEIADVSFRYFDGEAWVEIWDSTAMDRLPQAIEVTLRFRDAAAEADAPAALSSVVPIGQTVRHVIAVSLAEPAAAVSAL